MTLHLLHSLNLLYFFPKHIIKWDPFELYICIYSLSQNIYILYCVYVIMLKNVTKNIIISNDCIICNTFWLMLRGLMFRSNKRPTVLIFNKFQKCYLHNCFVFFSTNVFFLNSSGRVVEIKKNFLPFSFYMPKNKSTFVVEIPINIENRNISIGDSMYWD